MLTRLLACLALLTGLTAVGTPVAAASVQQLAAQVEQGAVVDCALADHAHLAPVFLATDGALAADISFFFLYESETNIYPTAYVGSDRARE